MGIIKTGLGIKRTIKNVARLREILTVFARNGLDELIIKSGVVSFIPNFVLPESKNRIRLSLDEISREDGAQILGYRLRKVFEDLGPTFIKFGQLLSTREDIFPLPFIREMQLLRDKVKGVPFEEVRNILERSLKQSPDKVFSYIDPSPIGTASIGVVHRARLMDNSEVVIKVRRPQIASLIETDYELFYFIITQIEKIAEEVRFLGLSRIIRDFHADLNVEMDFYIESLNNARLRTVIEKYDPDKIFYLPKFYKEYLSEDVIVMEYLDGVPFSDAEKVNNVLGVIQDKLQKGLVVLIHTILQEGFFHADLHGGNFFLLKDHRIGIVDFGLMGSLGRKNRLNFVAIIYSLMNHNYENLVFEFLEVAEYTTVPDVDELIRDVKAGLSPYVGLTVQQTNFSLVMRTIVQTLSKHQIFLPREWFVVFRAMLTLDGVGKNLKMDIDLLPLMEGEINQLIKKVISKEELFEESVWLSRDVLGALRILPRHLRWFLKDFSKKNFTIEVKNRGYEDQLDRLTQALLFLGLCFLTGTLGLAGVFSLGVKEAGTIYNVSALSWVFWTMALTILTKAMFMVNIRKK